MGYKLPYNYIVNNAQIETEEFTIYTFEKQQLLLYSRSFTASIVLYTACADSETSYIRTQNENDDIIK